MAKVILFDINDITSSELNDFICQKKIIDSENLIKNSYNAFCDGVPIQVYKFTPMRGDNLNFSSYLSDQIYLPTTKIHSG